LVFRIPQSPSEPQPLVTAVEIVDFLQRAKLKIKLFKSIDKEKVICLVGASEGRLEREAEHVAYELLLDPHRLIQFAGEEGLVDLSGAFRITDWQEIHARFNPKFRYLYTKYDYDGLHHRNSVFRQIDRIKLTIRIMQTERVSGGAGLRIPAIIKMNNTHLYSMFPLHEPEQLLSVQREWFSWTSIIDQPLDSIRDYFGEEVTIYFAFLRKSLCLRSWRSISEFYNRMLVPITLVGIIFSGIL